MSSLVEQSARGLNVGDKVLLQGAFIIGTPRQGRVHTFLGTVPAGEIDPAGTPFPTPEELMWFVDSETGMPCPMPVNYVHGFPCEADLTFRTVDVH